MRKFTSFVVAISVLFQTSLQALPLPYSVIGQFADEQALNEPYSKRMGVLKALAIDATILPNERFLCGVEDHYFATPVLPSSIYKLQTHNYRGGQAPDIPVNHVYLILQRLYPSVDGIDLVPNTRSHDPVARLTPITLGILLDEIRDFDEKLLDGEAPIASKNHEVEAVSLANRIYYDLYPPNKRDERKIYALIKRGEKCDTYQAYGDLQRSTRNYQATLDLTRAIVKALVEQKALFPHTPYFVENVLFGFAMRKAAETQDPFEAMLSFFHSMPNIIRSDWVPANPFTLDYYNEVVSKLEERSAEIISELNSSLPSHQPVEVTRRDYLAFMVGTSEFADLFPPLHVYRKVKFKNIAFPNCGEVSLLNFINMLLWDFDKKVFRFESLMLPDGNLLCHKDLYDFYKVYSTPEKQFTIQANDAWTRVVSGRLGGDGKPLKGINYKRGICEITGGVSSMAGVLRALFPGLVLLTDDIEDELKLTRMTFNAVLGLFKPFAEIWKWKVHGAGFEQEHNITSENGFKIDFFKFGKNLPSQDVVSCIKPLFTWVFSPGHYSVTSLSVKPKFPFIALEKIQRFLTSRKPVLSPLDRWIISKCGSLGKHGIWELVFLCNESPDDQPEMFSGIVNNLDPVKLTLLAQIILPTLELNTPVQVGEVLATLPYVALGDNSEASVKVGRTMANAIERLPDNDPYAITSILEQVITDDGRLDQEHYKLHLRINEKIHQLAYWLGKDSSLAFDCLLNGIQHEGTDRFLMECIGMGELTNVQVLQLLSRKAGEGFGISFWGDFFYRFGDAIGKVRSHGTLYETFMNYSGSRNENSVATKLVASSSVETILWLRDQGWLSEHTIQNSSHDALKLLLQENAEYWDLPRLVSFAILFGINFEQISELRHNFLEELIDERAKTSPRDVVNVLDALNFKPGQFIFGDPVLEIMTPGLDEFLYLFFTTFSITREHYTSYSDVSYYCDEVIKRFDFDTSEMCGHKVLEYDFPSSEHWSGSGSALNYLSITYPDLFDDKVVVDDPD